ncbi:MAG TPA: hypothetical protein DEQ02_06255 [Ruminococcaceae bacterium]|nr:hypothetical protein [Oscillospiraceae bacterium]
MATAKYLRFSVDDGNTSDSESVSNQRDLLDWFISANEDLRSGETLEFVDDGFTGTNFHRDGFISMMEAVKARKVDCIIVKDFSRLGRHYIEVSDYIDQIFPFLGVRFIAVNEQYDSKTANAALGVDMAMKNIIYDLYSRDLSKKVRSARKSLMKKGEYIAPFAIYGYTNKQEKKRLVVDPTSAEVVKRIFGLATDGVKARQIAIRLNDEGIPTPNEYNRLKSTEKQHYVPMDTAPLWTADIVRRILQDERYTGKMVCGKYTTVKRKTILIPKDEWVITPNTHEAIVSEEVFEQAQAIFRTRSKITMPDEPKSILTGTMKCGCCKKSLAFESRYRRAFYCHNRNMGFGCEDTKVDESVLIDTIFAAVKVKLALIEFSEQSYIADQQAKAAEYASAKKELDTKLKKLRLAQATALEDYLEGKSKKSEFQSHKSKTAALIQEVEERLSALGTLSENSSGLVEQHRPFYGQDTLTREMVKELVKEVRVHSPTELEIVWRFGECYHELEQGFMPNLNV